MPLPRLLLFRLGRSFKLGLLLGLLRRSLQLSLLQLLLQLLLLRGRACARKVRLARAEAARC